MTTADLVKRMVADLRKLPDLDLGDEREVMRALQAEHYGMGDIIACIDRVIEETRLTTSLRSFG